MGRLSPFLYYFQDPSTVFAFHLIYTHNLIHWYLALILFFVYFSVISLLRNFRWNYASKSRGLLRALPSTAFSSAWHSRLFRLSHWMLDYALVYYIEKSLLWTDALLELRDDPKSYLYYYHGRSLYMLQELLRAADVPFTLLQDWELEDVAPELYLRDKLEAECDYFGAVVAFVERPTSLESSNPPRISRHSGSPEEWTVHKHLDSYFLAYFSPLYSLSSWSPQRAFLAAQRGNDSLQFEYICVILPTLIVFIILAHSLSLLYSGSEEINPGLHFTAIGHQWFWSYELETIIKRTTSIPFICEDGMCPPRESSQLLFLSAAFDSIPVTESSLSFGGKRLLEVDNPLVLPIGVPLKALATSGDVLHSWAVPEMGIKMDAVPGRINDSISFIQRPGVFYGQCSELCGVGHGFMPIVVEALDIPNFIAWAEKLQS